MTRNWSARDGLSQTTVSSVVQDDLGFLWISTEDGVDRFDGKEFKVFRRFLRDTTEVGVARIYKLIYTSGGYLLGGTDEAGIILFDRDREVFNVLPLYPDHANDPGANTVRFLFDRGNGTVLLGTDAGLYQFDPVSRSIVNIHSLLHVVPEKAQVVSIAGTGDNVMFTARLAPDTGMLFELSDDLGTATLLDPARMGLPDIRREYLQMSAGMDMEVYAATPDAFFRRHGHEDRFSKMSLLDGQVIRKMFPLPHGHLGMTATGLYFMDPDGSSERIKLPLPRHSDVNIQLTDLTEGTDGAIWVGSYEGLFQIDPISAKFHHFGPGGDHDLPFCDTKIRSILKDPLGRIWVGMQRGLDLIQPDLRSVMNLVPNRPNSEEVAFQGLALDHRGNVWGRTRANGLFCWHPDLSRPRPYEAGPERSVAWGKSLCVNPDGSMFTGHRMDLIAPDGMLLSTKELSGSVLRLELDDPFSTYRDRTGTYWFGTMNKGVYTFTFNAKERSIADLKVHSPDPDVPGSLSNGFVTSVREDGRGMIWLGTYGGGLNRYDRATGLFSALTTKTGLPNNVIYAIEIDRLDRVWFTSNAGIGCLDQRDGGIRTYDERDRVQSLEFNATVSFQAADGEIFFGGVNGFNSFYPDSIQLNPHRPRIAFTGLMVGNTAMGVGAPGSPLHRSIVYQDSLELSHEQNDLTVQFAALSFISPEKNRFAYMLHGYADEWVQLGTQNQVSFTNLDPGRYELRVKAANNDGVWNDQYRSLHLIIAPPWYRTSTATALFIVCGASFLFGLGWIVLSRIRLRYQVGFEHDEAVRAKAEDQRRARFFINLAHDLRTPLTLIKQRVEQLASHPNGHMDEPTTQVLRRSVDKLTGRITALLETARLERDHIALDTRPTSINELVHVILADFRPMAADRSIELSFVPAPGDPIAELDRTKITMAVENLLTNAFKFTPDGGRITASVSSIHTGDGADAARITVQDTGPGIAAEDHQRIFELYERTDGPQVTGKVGAGVGLFHVRQIMEMHGGKWSVESAVGQGTSIHLELPLKVGRDVVATPVNPIAAANPASSERTIADEEPTDNGPDGRPIALVIEDDHDLNAAIAELLRTEFRTFSAFNGEEGIAKAFDLVPDVVITDVMMPLKDGFEVCRTLKNDIRTSHVPVIMLTAITDMEERIRGLHEGADDFLPKPYEPRELLARARNAILRTRKVMDLNRAAIGTVPAQALDPVRDMDRIFLEQVHHLIGQHFHEPGLSVESLADMVAMSRGNLSRKLTALIDRPPKDLIREKRMKAARELLERGVCNVTEAMERSGYENPSSFSNAFKDFWGQPPSSFLRRT